MPAILNRLINQLQAKGHGAGASRAIAISALQKSGNLKKNGTEATAKGLRRGKMSAGARAKDRAVKYHGGKPSDYVYNRKTNLATKK